jgi:hypothetical protein
MAAAGYSETPLWKKLGVRNGDTLVLFDAPAQLRIPDLPKSVSVLHKSSDRGLVGSAEVIVAFFAAAAEMRSVIPVLAPLVFPSGAIWAAWPRRAGGHSSDIRDEDIRSVALPLGLVDVKVAALDQDWSGLRLVWRKELRETPRSTPG